MKSSNMNYRPKSDSVLVAAVAFACAVALSGCNFLGGAKAHLKRAESELSAGNSYIAKIEAKKSLAINAKQPKAWLVLARADFLQNDSPAADIAIDKAKAAGASATELAPLELKSLYVKGHYALIRVRLAQDTFLSPLVKNRYEGLALLGLHKPNQALTRFNAALALNAQDVESLVGKALALRLLGQTPAALSTLVAAQKASPKSARLALALANTYIGANDLGNAEHDYELAASLTSAHRNLPTWIMAEAGFAQTAIMQAKWSDAKRAVNELNHGMHGLLLTRLLKARIALGEGHLPEAATAAQAVASAMPADVQAHMLLAFATYRQGYPQEAETSLDEVLTAHPDYAPARKLLASIQLKEGRTGAARRTLAPLLSASPGPNTLILAGRIAQTEQNKTEADQYFSQALAAKNVTNEMRYDVAVYYLRDGEKAKALSLLNALPSGTTVGKKRDLLLALMAGSNGHGDKAKAALAQVAAKYSSDIVLQRTIAKLYASHGDFKDAIAQLNGILKTHPNDIDSLVGLSRIYAAAGNAHKASRLLKRALAIQPKNVTVLMSLAELAAEKNNSATEIAYLEKARSAHKSALAPRLALARLYLAKYIKNPSDKAALQNASAPLQEALSLAPHDIAVVLIDSQYEYQAGHANKAKQVLANAVTSDPSTTPLLLTLASLQIKTNQASKAYDTLNKVLRRSPGWLPAVRELAALYTDNQNYTEALNVARRAQTVKGENAQATAEQKAGALYIEGEVYATEAARSASDSQALYAKSAKTFIDSYTVYPAFNTAVRVFQTRKAAGLADATMTLQDYTLSHPMDIEALNTLSNYYLSKKKYTKAAAVYTTAIADGAATPGNYNNLAWLYYQAHNPKALATARKAVAFGHVQPQIIDTLGWILAHSGKLDEALPYISKAYSRAPDNYDIGYHYAWVLSKLGHRHQALAVLNRILSTHANFASRGKAEGLKESIS